MGVTLSRIWVCSMPGSYLHTELVTVLPQ